MSYCLNPECRSPQNAQKAEVCKSCGAKLLLKERYRAIAAIGQGGFGRTFLAIDEHKPSKPRCVIKQFLPTTQNPRNQKKAADLFEQEAMRLEELGNHPQIPALLAHFRQDQQQYLVQEYIAGSNLADVQATQGTASEAQVRSVLTNLLPVLDFIHAHQVIHRDIKPANIIALPGSAFVSPPSAKQPDWSVLLQALSQETAYGFRDFVNASNRFGEWISGGLAQVPSNLAIADYRRCQEMASQFACYARLGLSQRQYLVADASRLLYEMRRKYARPEFSPTAQLVLVDFGAAKSIQLGAIKAAAGDPTRTGTAIGSPGYTAPEQANGKAVFASDLYSLGVTCLHLLTAASPFDLFDPHTNRWIWRQWLPAPVSDRLARVLDQLIEPGLNQRYPAAAVALQDLEPSVLSIHLKRSVEPAANLPEPEPVARRRTQPAWQCVHTLVSPGKVYAIALSPTEPILASSSGTTIKLWDLQTGQPLRTLSGHLDIVAALAISPDGKLLISGSADKTIKIWELATGQRLASLTAHTDTVLAVAIAPDGQSLASSSFYDPITIWDIRTGQEQDRFYGHADRIDVLTFSPDGKLLASGSGDATIKLWEFSTNQERTLPGHGDRISALSFSPDGKTLASASWDGSVKFWSTATRRVKRTLPITGDRVNAVVFSSNGKTLITGSTSLQLWNIRTGKDLGTLSDALSDIDTIATSAPYATVDAATGDTIAIANRNGKIQIWQAIGTAG
jgi:serine/threonine protein kinase